MTLDAILEDNRRWARGRGREGASARPARGLAVLTCMDARIAPLALLGLEPGDAHVVRNAGGRATEAVRSLAMSCALFDTRRILVIHHTDCGLCAPDESALRARVRERLGVPAEGLELLSFSDLDESVRADVRTLRRSPLIPAAVAIDGLIYDVQTGLLRVVP